MNTIWKQSAVGAELVETNEQEPKKEKVLGMIEIAHGYCHTWIINNYGTKIPLNCRFEEYLEQCKKDVEKALAEKGILTPTPNDANA